MSVTTNGENEKDEVDVVSDDLATRLNINGDGVESEKIKVSAKVLRIMMINRNTY